MDAVCGGEGLLFERCCEWLNDLGKGHEIIRPFRIPRYDAPSCAFQKSHNSKTST